MDDKSTDWAYSLAGFEARVATVDDHAVVSFHGDIDLTTSDACSRAVDEALARSQRIVVDLADVRFMDAIGLNLLSRAVDRLGGSREGVIVRGPAPMVRKVLAISGIDKLVMVDETVSDRCEEPKVSASGVALVRLVADLEPD